MLSVYDYQDAAKYLSDYLSTRKASDPAFSLGSWAKSAGFSSPAPIVEVLKGSKTLKPALVAKIIGEIGLDPSEHVYFQVLAAKAKAATPLERRMYELFMKDLSPKQRDRFSSRRFEDTDIYSHWIFTTLLSMAEIDGFEFTSKNVRACLREKLPLEIIDAATGRLFELGLLENVDGVIRRKYDRVSTKNDRKHPGAQAYFSQMSDLAKKSFDLPVHLREFQSFSFAMPMDRMPLAKDIIRKCRDSLAALCEGKGEEVYQMNMFLFPLTQRDAAQEVDRAAG